MLKAETGQKTKKDKDNCLNHLSWARGWQVVEKKSNRRALVAYRLATCSVRSGKVLFCFSVLHHDGGRTQRSLYSYPTIRQALGHPLRQSSTGAVGLAPRVAQSRWFVECGRTPIDYLDLTFQWGSALCYSTTYDHLHVRFINLATYTLHFSRHYHGVGSPHCKLALPPAPPALAVH